MQAAVWAEARLVSTVANRVTIRRLSGAPGDTIRRALGGAGGLPTTAKSRRILVLDNIDRPRPALDCIP